MTGVVIDHARLASYDSMMSQLRRIAQRQADHEIHAKVMAKTPEGQADLNQAARIITDCDAVRAVVTVRTTLDRTYTQTDARQVCLTDLVCRLQRSGSMDIIKLDSLDNLGISFQSTRPRPDSKNIVDMTTLRALQKAGELDSATRLFHANSRTTSQLWIPDVAGYMMARSLARSDPSYMSLLASKVELYEARTLPVAMREPGRDSLAPSGLDVALADHVVQAYSCLVDANDPVSMLIYQALRDHADQELRNYMKANRQRQPPSGNQLIGKTHH